MHLLGPFAITVLIVAVLEVIIIVRLNIDSIVQKH